MISFVAPGMSDFDWQWAVPDVMAKTDMDNIPVRHKFNFRDFDLKVNGSNFFIAMVLNCWVLAPGPLYAISRSI